MTIDGGASHQLFDDLELAARAGEAELGDAQCLATHLGADAVSAGATTMRRVFDALIAEAPA